MKSTCTALMIWIGLASPLWADAPVDYLHQVKPILEVRCYACHGALRQNSELRVDTAAALIAGGLSGPAVVPGEAEESLLIHALRGTEGASQMPEEGEPLSTAEIALIARWINEGAQAPPDEAPPPDPRAHWAFQAPVKPPQPQVDRAGWLRNALDAFISAEHDARKLAPQPPASKEVLLRRVYLDLIGLPPTPSERDEFLADESAGAYERVVERLLASPHYGERWGRHWMDIWRYADWYGLGEEVRNSQKHIWRWRDWIVKSLNEDKGYDRMVAEMLAGDELAPTDAEALEGTGFLVRNFYLFNRNVWLDDVIEHTCKAMLGLTMNCARCHAHKYDPFSQEQYYELRAFFEPHRVRTDIVPGEADLEKDGLPRVYDADLDTPTYLLVRGNEKQPDKDRPMSPKLPEVLSWDDADIHPIALPVEAYYPALRPHAVAATRTAAGERVTRAEEMLAAAKHERNAADEVLHDKELASARAHVASLEARIVADSAKYLSEGADLGPLAQAAAQAERQSDLMDTVLVAFRAQRDLAAAMTKLAAKEDKEKSKKLSKAVAAAQKELADAQKRLEKVKEQLAKGGGDYTPLGKEYPKTSSGRRLALANWVTDRRHPLTARVAVNHIWMRHFGQPLVATVFDFGLNGQAPSHPALLDWLAVEFIEHGWSMKWLHRLIVTSNAYQMTSSSAGGASAAAADPDNRYLWRMNSRRMESQIVRDSVLYLAGELDLALGGPEIPPEKAKTEPRRSVYFRHSRDSRLNFLGLFDDAAVEECYRRAESVVPQQALALANSELFLSRAERIAGRLGRDLPSTAGSQGNFIAAAFETILARRPTSDELAECEKSLAETIAWLGEQNDADAVPRARADLVHVLLNHNDFITIR